MSFNYFFNNCGKNNKLFKTESCSEILKVIGLIEILKIIKILILIVLICY